MKRRVCGFFFVLFCFMASTCTSFGQDSPEVLILKPAKVIHPFNEVTAYCSSDGFLTVTDANNKIVGISNANLSIGNGLIANDYFDGLQATGNNSTILADEITNNDYISFTVTPQANVTIRISSIKFAPESQNRPRTFALFSSHKGFSATNILSSFDAEGGPQQTISITDHNNLSTVEFRMYFYSDPKNDYEAVGLNNVSGADLVIIGSVTGELGIEFPLPPTNLTATEILEKSFTLSWVASNHATTYEVFNNETLVGTTKDTPISIPKLSCNTTYSMAVKAVNILGTSEVSAALGFTTLACPPPPMSDTAAVFPPF